MTCSPHPDSSPSSQQSYSGEAHVPLTLPSAPPLQAHPHTHTHTHVYPCAHHSLTVLPSLPPHTRDLQPDTTVRTLSAPAPPLTPQQPTLSTMIITPGPPTTHFVDHDDHLHVLHRQHQRVVSDQQLRPGNSTADFLCVWGINY